MGVSASNGLLSAEGAVLVDPADVERALVEMWTPAAEAAGGDSSAKTATRVSVANLIVVAPAGEWDQLLEVMAGLSPLMPTRTIVLLIADGADEPEQITARVSALCHVPQDGEAQVCCEQIVLRAGTRHVGVLDQTLLPLLESDVPVMCWWHCDARAWPELFNAIRAIARRIILDGVVPQPLVESTERCAVRDLGWYRTAGLRELLASLFDGCTAGAVQAIDRVEIDAGCSLGGEIEGFWLVAFLAGQLGWDPLALKPHDPRHHGVCGGCFEFTSSGRKICVRFAKPMDGGPRLRRIQIVSSADTFDLEYRGAGGNEYRITVSSHQVCGAPRSVQVPPVTTAQALAAALAGRRVDAAFERAWPIANWMVRAPSELRFPPAQA